MESVWNIIEESRKTDRPTALDYIVRLFSDFIEFHGDRQYADDSAIAGGIARLEGIPVTVIGIQKGRNTNESINRNFGMPNPEGYRKALRLMKQAEKFKRPVITIINTAGAYCGIGAEERGQGEAIARNLMEMSALKVPVIAILTGEGGSGGALALAVADRVWITENATYSILSPEGFASILWKDSSRAKEAAELMKMTAPDLLNLGVVDMIFEEDENFWHNMKKALKDELRDLLNTKTDFLLNERYKKFRIMGNYASKGDNCRII